MKQENNYLSRLYSWPEEIRVTVAVVLFLVSVAVLFILWRAEVSSTLTLLLEESSIATPPAQVIDRKQETAPGPLFGISETLLSVGTIFPGISFDIDKESLQAGVWQTFYDIGKTTDNILRAVNSKLWPI